MSPAKHTPKAPAVEPRESFPVARGPNDEIEGDAMMTAAHAPAGERRAAGDVRQALALSAAQAARALPAADRRTSTASEG